MSSNTKKFLAQACRSYLTRNSKKLKLFNHGDIGVKTINFDDYRRIINPPLFLVNDNDFSDTVINTSGQLVKFKVAETSHGIYLKPQERVYCGWFEMRFGYGLFCAGFDPNRVTYFPIYSR
jgi:hypothetical protein